MQKTILALFPLLLAQSAFAGDYYKCYDLADSPEWTLEINLKSKKAAFFDNDSWSVVRFLRTDFLETAPPQTRHVFSGKDAYNAPMQVFFNETRMKGTVLVDYGTSKQQSYEAKGGCEAVQAKDLYSGI